jgi:hypothetical protein
MLQYDQNTATNEWFSAPAPQAAAAQGALLLSLSLSLARARALPPLRAFGHERVPDTH